MSPLKKDRARAPMQVSFWYTAESLRFSPLYIIHGVAFMVMALAFHTKYPDGVEDTLKIFLFPNLYPSTGS